MAKSRVLFIAPLPPPVHGSAMVSQYIKDSKLVNELHDCDFVNLSTSRRMDEIGKGGMKKLLRFIGSYLALLGKLLTHRYDLCYLAITCHGMGFLKDAPFVLLCKLFRRKVLIHQHNKGMSHCVNRWPYRWLMPLVYRNTRVMLLSWHLYDDIAAVVKREQVVICANGIPQQSNNNPCTLNSKQVGSHTDFTDYTDGKSLMPLLASGVSAINEGERLKAAEQRLIATESQVKSCKAAVKPESSLLTAHSSSLSNSTQEYFHTDFTDYTDGKSLTPLLASGGAAINEGERLKVNGEWVTAMSATPSPSGEGWGEAPHLLFLSNLIPSKGVYVLLDACRMLHERGLTFVCDFVGGETKEIDRATFEAAVKERGLEGIARYQGPKYGEEKERYFAEADIFVQPTYEDCFPLTIVEAMQHRLPVVSTTEGAVPDLIQHGVNGYTVARKEAAPLAEALAQLITDPALRTAMGEAGYARYREQYTLEAFECRFVAQLMQR